MTTFSDLVESFCASVESHVNERIRNALLGALSSSTSEPSSFFPGKVRRGPGRPRKNPLEVRRGPGRPRKNPEDSVVNASVAKTKKPGSPAMKAHGRYIGLLNWARHRGLPSHLKAAAKIKATKGSKAAGDFLAGLRDKAAKSGKTEAKAKVKSAKGKTVKAKGKIVVVDGAKLSRKASKAAKAVVKAVKRAKASKAAKASGKPAKEASGNGLALAT